MADSHLVTEQEYERARMRPGEPIPVSVRYDPGSDRLVVAMSNGVEVAIPRMAIRGFAEARPEQLEDPEPVGGSVYWPGIEELLDVQETVIDLFDIRTHLARIAASVRTPATAIASRKNGSKGGRPRKAPGSSPAAAAREASVG